MQVSLIYGPPGTGKTTRLMSILERELQDTPSQEIAYVSFTRQGAYEGAERARSLYNLSKKDVPYFRTLHSIAYRELAVTPDQVIDKNHYKVLSDKLGMRFLGYYTEDLRHNDDRYIFYDRLVRNNRQAGLYYLNDLDNVKLELVRNTYKRFRRDLGIYDFTDMIQQFIDNKTVLPVKVAIIDEAQDLTTLQWRMVWTAFSNAERVYIAGDDDQAVYEWSGADVNYFLNLHGEQTILDKSYRLPKLVWQYANKITGAMANRIPKVFSHVGETGRLKVISRLRELQIDNEKTWLFLARNNKDLNLVTDYIRSLGLPYIHKGKKSIKTELIKAIHTYEGMRRGETEKWGGHLHRLYKLVDYERVGFIKPWYDVFNLPDKELVYYRDIFANKTNPEDRNIRVDTIHGSKGSEADNVVLLTDISRNVSKNYSTNMDSELRVFYVGVTRARENLYLLEPKGDKSLPYLDFYLDTKVRNNGN